MNNSKTIKQLVMYCVFGVLTTLVNIILYYACKYILGFSVSVSTIIAWILSVFFAFITNKTYVFNSSASGFTRYLREGALFFASRLGTGLFDLGIMFIFAEKLGFNDLAVKILSNIVVIILNYILSKFMVFRNQKKNQSEDNE